VNDHREQSPLAARDGDALQSRPCHARNRSARRRERGVSASQRIREIREGFAPAFWVANVSELFERLAYYGVQAVLAIYLHETLRFSDAQTGDLIGYFGGIVWFLPILGGALADAIGFRRALSLAYLVLSIGYFLLGSLGAPWMAPVAHAMPLGRLVLLVLLIPALGPAIVKPCVVGTTARASKENVRSIGYSIYYTLVNIGGALGPLIASVVHQRWGVPSVFRVAALAVFLMVFAVVFFFKNPDAATEKRTANFGAAVRNFWAIVSNFQFLAFLIIFSGFWIAFWQQYIALPLYLHSYVNANANVERILATDALTVIFLQVPITYLTRWIPAFPAMALGVLISGSAWLILASHASVAAAVCTLVVVALGETIQAARYYEYISRLAPPGQQGTYMGFAFLPIAIGFVIAGAMGGRLVHYFGEIAHQPQRVWWVFSAIGFATTLLLWLYNRLVRPSAVPA
jgi:proton-dependent oligopeptide transporter, POT family